jgi:UDP-N-acetylglucosamine acyltransferase
MSCRVHSSTIIDGDVTLGEGVEIGPFSMLSGSIRIGDRVRIESHVRLVGNIEMGTDNTVYSGCCFGETAQPGSTAVQPSMRSGVSIGTGNIFRENVTIHSPARPGNRTVIGNDNRVMVGTHIAHDCRVGNCNELVNLTLLAGFVVIQDHVYVAGGARIVTAVRLGTGSFIDACSLVTRDVPPFFQLSNRGCLYRVRGDRMKILGYSDADVARLQSIGRTLWRGGTWAGAFQSLSEAPETIDFLLREFLRTSDKGMCSFAGRRSAGTATGRK